MATLAHHHSMKVFHPSLGSLTEAVREGFAAWRTRAREREALAAMSERDLHDIGLSRWDADYEAAKPFWRM